ncbi:hypothetical protein KR018_010359 [Drosophila ironensis]|nr:hypothetical protein KR018_010359 [Drosophila ironensis]
MTSKATFLLLLLLPLLDAQNFQDYSPFLQPRIADNQPAAAQQSYRNPGNTQSPQQENFEVLKTQPRATKVLPTRPPPVYSFMDRFSSKLFQKIAPTRPRMNLVYSPLSVHTMLGLMYGVSKSQTNDELRVAGDFDIDPLNVAQSFQAVIIDKAQLGRAELTMVSKLYHNQLIGGVNPDYPKFADHYFSVGDEAVDMQSPKDTAERINTWATDATRGKIRDLVTANDIDAQTQALLVNAIYFKGLWENGFATIDTLPTTFYHSDGSSSSVAMMYNDDTYALADIPELDATALELAYKDSGASMLILLPKRTNGLQALEQGLARQDFDLNRISSRLQRQTVTVRIPKFRIEVDQDMVRPLMQLGVREMFTSKSQVVTMLNQPVRVDKILQKAYIDVNEAGTEATAASCKIPCIP